MGFLSINMSQFRRKWSVYQDNLIVYEKIVLTNGRLWVLDARPYVDWLQEFCIFYTYRS